MTSPMPSRRIGTSALGLLSLLSASRADPVPVASCPEAVAVFGSVIDSAALPGRYDTRRNITTITQRAVKHQPFLGDAVFFTYELGFRGQTLPDRPVARLVAELSQDLSSTPESERRDGPPAWRTTPRLTRADTLILQLRGGPVVRLGLLQYRADTTPSSVLFPAALRERLEFAVSPEAIAALAQASGAHVQLGWLRMRWSRSAFRAPHALQRHRLCVDARLAGRPHTS